MAAEGPITTAILGLGRAGYGIHVRLLRDRDDYKIVAVADPNEERCKEVADEFGCDTFGDLDAMLAGSDAELVVVATASNDHTPHAIKALEAGRNVVVEKPFAVDLKQADALIAARDKSGKMLTVHQSARWASDLCFIREMLHDDRLGDVFHVRKGGYGFSQRNDWQTLRKYGGGALNNNGVHALDQCYLVLESDVKDVWGDLRQVLAAGDAEDHCQVIVRGENGRVVQMDLTSACAAKLPSWVVMGTRGTLVVQEGKATLRYAKEIPDLPEPEDAPIVKTRAYGVVGEVPKIEFVEEELEPKADAGPDYYSRVHATLREGAELFVKPKECRAVLDIMVRAREGTAFPA